MEEVTKCRYIDCVDTREKEQILHELPVCDDGLRTKWLLNSGHLDLIGKDLDVLRSMRFFVCNSHFTEDCYLSKGTLRENAVPIPHWSALSRRLKNLKTRRKTHLNGQGSSMEEAATDQFTEKNVTSEFEVDQWCRTCAIKKENLISMTIKGKGTEMSLLSKLKLLIEIEDGDALPTKMCDECVDKLEQSFKFFQQIYIADNTLRYVFPSTQSSNTVRKPFYSLDLRNDQTESEQLMQLQDRTPKVTRGIFRRGRGRPRSRPGYAGRSRGRASSRAAHIPVTIRHSNVNDNMICETEANQTILLGNESLNVTLNEESQGDTVYSLLTGTCYSDEELDWSDVLKVMNNQKCCDLPKLGDPPKINDKLQKKAEAKISDLELEPENEAEPEVEPELELEPELKLEPEPEAVLLTVTREEEPKIESKIEGKAEIEPQPNTNIEMTTEEEAQPVEVNCEFCDQQFKVTRQLQIHLSTDHSQLSGYMCTDCLTCYESEVLLSKHRSTRHKVRRYRCEYCKNEFIGKKTLRDHINICQSHDTVRYSCDSCGLMFAFKQDLVEHMKTHPESLIITLSTDLDLKNLEESSNEIVSSLKDTVELECQSVPPSNTNETLQSNSSSLYDKTGSILNLVDTFQMDTEKEIEQTNRQLSVTCPDCKEEMHDSVELSVHRMRRHSIDRKDTTCLLCENKSFPSIEEYEQHVIDHCKRLRISQ